MVDLLAGVFSRESLGVPRDMNELSREKYEVSREPSRDRKDPSRDIMELSREKYPKIKVDIIFFQ